MAEPTRRKALVSVVVPVYFNEANIPVTWLALGGVLETLPDDLAWEVVFVDDGSGDDSYARLLEAQRSAPERVRVVKLTRNFGQTAAILAGMSEARGDCVVVMSADLQDPPELIPTLIERWQRGARKVVLATRAERDESAFRRLTSQAFYRLMRRYAIPEMPIGGFDFFLIDRVVVDFLVENEDRSSFLQGRILWPGHEPVLVPYRRRRRELGRSRWTLSKKLKYFADGFVTHTVAPIRLITLVGLVVSLLSFSYALLIFFARLVYGHPVEGWAPTMVAILGLGGVQLVMLGVIGEYLWRNYHETRRLPNFVVESVNRGSEPAAHEPVGEVRRTGSGS